MNAKILEIFQSIQGEGKYAGVRQIFVRFFECHMHCQWCDTPHSIGDTSRHFQEYSLEQVVERINEIKTACHSVSLTGGEPLLQTDFIKELLPLLKSRNMKAYLETSGVLYEKLAQIVNEIDIVAMDFKLPSSTQCQSFWKEHEEFLKMARHRDIFIKAVITSDTKMEDIQEAIRIISSIAPQTLVILQPNFFELKNGVVKKCLEFQEECLKYLPYVRVMPQAHKMMKIR